jgi:hypothetical protein
MIVRRSGIRSMIVTSDKRVQAVRGSTVEPARRYAMQLESRPEWEAFVEALAPEQRALLERPISRRDWYDLRTYAEFIDVAARTLGAGDPERFLTDAGRFVFDDGVNTLYRAFFRIASPSLVIRGSARLWGLFFRGPKLVITSHSRRSAAAALREADFCSMSLCISIRSGMGRALEHGGAREVVVEEHRCRSEGGSECTFRYAWR